MNRARKPMPKRCIALFVALLLFLPMLIQPLSASPAPAPIPVSGTITGVEGRTLTPDLTGDSVNWIEIARVGSYALIVRTEYIRRFYRPDDPAWQYVAYGATNAYMASNVRNRINGWFNALVPAAKVTDHVDGNDVLPADARLRSYTMQHNAISTLGTRYSATNLTDGQSRPYTYQVGVGDDIAFALSYSEVANFLSITRNFPGATTANYGSPPEAIANYRKLNIPTASGAVSGLWMRTPGSIASTACATWGDGYAHEMSIASSSAQRGYIYPALWVEDGIFNTAPVGPANPIDRYPTVVDGRILTPEMTGDIVNWVEIAQNGDYSLIVRANFLNLQSFNYGDPLWQSARWQAPRDGTTNVGYTKDNVSHVINCWFNFLEVRPDPQGINTYYDVLPANARLRNYTMQHNALSTLGTRYTATTLTDGLSKPTNYQVGIGDNIAFCLSFSEAANYLSITRNFPGATTTTYISPPEAAANFAKVHIPKSTVGFYYAMWLRSPGNHATTQCALLDTGYTHELNILNEPAGNLPNNHAFGYGLIYPAVWVGQGIFRLTPDYSVTYHPGTGGVGGSTDRDLAEGSAYAIKNRVEADVARPSHGLREWNTSIDGSGIAYRPGDVITIDRDLVLYAIWYRID